MSIFRSTTTKISKPTMADPSGNMRCAKSEEDLEEGEIADDGYDQLDSRSPPTHLEVPNFTLSEYDQSIHGTSSARGFIKEKADRAGISVAVHNANAEDSNRSSQFSDPAEQVEDMGQQQLVHIEKVIMESKVALENAYAVRDQLIGLGASGRFENGQNTQAHSATRNPSGTAFDTPYSPPNCNTPSSSESVPTTASEPRKSSSFSPEYMQDYHIEADLVRTGDDTLNLEIRSPLFQIDDDDARSNPDSAKPIDQRTRDLIEAFITDELNDRVDGTESRNLSTKFEINSRRMHHGRFVLVAAYIWTGSYDRKEEYGDGHPTKYIATPWGLLAVNSYLMFIVDWNEREFWGLPCFAYSKRELDKLPQFIVDDIVPLQRVRLNRGLPSSDRNAGEIRVAYYSGSGSAYMSKKYATFSLHAPMDDAPGFVLNEDFTTLKKILDEKHDEMSLALKTSASIIPQPHKLVEQRRSRESQLSETQEHQGYV